MQYPEDFKTDHRLAPPPAGLEVVHDNVDKVFLRRDEDAPEVFYEPVDKVSILKPATISSSDGPTLIPSSERSERKRPVWRRKRVLVSAAIVILIIIIGAVVGGVVGSRQPKQTETPYTDTPENPNAKSPPIPSSSPSATGSEPKSSASVSSVGPVPTSIHARSGLSATAFRDEGTKSNIILLAYQAPDGNLSITKYTADDGKDEGSWGKPQIINYLDKPINPTPIAITSLYMPSDIQVDFSHLSYIDKISSMDSGITMSNFDFRSSTRPLNETAPAAASSISGYGPLLLYQQVDKALIFRRRQKGEGNFSYDWPGSADLDAMIGTQLALVPISANHTKIHWEDAVGMLYQDKNGKLVALNYNLLRGVYEVPKSWPFTFPDIEIPRTSAFAAVSVGRPGDEDSELVNTYVLYQDDSMDIKQVWTDGGKEWKMSAPEALKGADAGTSIACTTLGTLDIEGSRKLQPASELTRCYFRREGYLVEAQLDGTDWVILGNVPIP